VATAAGAKPAAYAQCAACHAVEPGKHGIGPSLHGVYGTKAGEIPGFAFSEKLKASGLTWDDATLDQWLAGPMKMVPGTKMSYAGLSDPAKRAEIIAYMKTLK
jgi:cytochrome c